ncbi:MAG TPA: hypothetical protein VK204_18965 [Nocardioidaceae bacterium]|nr:hypothetical protein [Nocardioidaceae bacterium]
MPDLTDAYVYCLVRWVTGKLAELAIVLGGLTLVCALVIWMVANVAPLGLGVVGALLVVAGLLLNNAEVPAPPALKASPGGPDGPTATWLRNRAATDDSTP